MKNKTEYSELNIGQLAAVIQLDWVKVNFAAQPYLQAMHSLNTPQDNYGYDSGKSVILYFLNNARQWTGDTAREVKAELKRRVK